MSINRKINTNDIGLSEERALTFKLLIVFYEFTIFV